MTVEEKVYAILKTAAGVLAYVPAERIKPPGDWQNLPAPYLVHFPVALETIHTHREGLMDLRIWRSYQISVFALKHSDARQIGEAVIQALDGYTDEDVDRIALTSIVPLPFDQEKPIAHVALDFEISGALQ